MRGPIFINREIRVIILGMIAHICNNNNINGKDHLFMQIEPLKNFPLYNMYIGIHRHTRSWLNG